jgi:transposase
LLCQKNSLLQVSKIESLGYDAVEGIYYRQSEKRKKEEFREIFENEISIVSALEKLNSWIQKAKQLSSKYFDTFTTTLLNWKTSILNYFKERLSIGFAEGINNKIKLIKRTAFGFNNSFHFSLRVISEFNPIL